VHDPSPLTSDHQLHPQSPPLSLEFKSEMNPTPISDFRRKKNFIYPKVLVCSDEGIYIYCADFSMRKNHHKNLQNM
jgi:hypothetical protein